MGFNSGFKGLNSNKISDNLHEDLHSCSRSSLNELATKSPERKTLRKKVFKKNEKKKCHVQFSFRLVLLVMEIRQKKIGKCSRVSLFYAWLPLASFSNAGFNIIWNILPCTLTRYSLYIPAQQLTINYTW